MSLADPTTLVEHLGRTRVLCVGDVMVDRFVYGAVDRISPEAPIPVLRASDSRSVLGGAGNVARNLAALGAEVRFVAVVGDDQAGAELRALAREVIGESAGVDGLVTVPGRPTTVKSRFVAGGQQMLRVDEETTLDLRPGDADAIVAAARERLEECEAVVLSDYGKGALAVPVLRAVIEAAGALGRPVFVDPKGLDYGRYRGALALTPNVRELAEACAMPVGDDAAVVAAAEAVIARAGVGAVLATRSQEGMTLVCAGDGPARHLPAVAREVYDVSGAGDTVVAVLAAAHAACGDLEAAAALANVAAGVVVGKLGTAVVEPSELIDAVLLDALGTAEAKVLGLEAAVRRVEEWRRGGLRVGFTNGCFDLLHPGHVGLLDQAARACDRLVVGLNADASVRRLKGEGRPVHGEAARSAVLASLRSVDAVVIFGEDTPLELIERLRPDVLVKGADYRLDEVVGAAVVQRYGGRVLLADLVDGFSTTATLERLDARRE